jgi:ABC-type nitrate/sulfonate/bicarbonate transport system substrate-binding protein
MDDRAGRLTRRQFVQGVHATGLALGARYALGWAPLGRQTIEIALFNDATEIVWRLADHLAAVGVGSPPPRRRFVRDADEAHRLSLDGTVPVVGMSLDDVVDCALSDHPNSGEITAFFGVHRGFLSVMAQPDITALAALRGRSIAVDTYSGYASALFQMLADVGIDYRHDLTVDLAGATNLRFEKLLRGEFGATLLGTPFDLLAAAQGFQALATVLDALGGYQAVVFAAHRSWLDRHDATARALTSTFGTTLAWARTAGNRQALRPLLRAGLPEGTPDPILERIADRLFGPASEFCPDGAIARRDAAVVLALFAKYRGVDLAGFDLGRVIDQRYAGLL